MTDPTVTESKAEKADDVKIRLANANDVEDITDLHLRSFTPEQHIPIILGRNFIKAAFHWSIKNDSTYTLVAEENSTVVGYISVCDQPYFKKMFLSCLPQFFLSILKNPKLLGNKLLWKRFLRREQSSTERGKKISNYPGIAQVMFGAVDESCRGKGIYTRLYHATREYSQKRGSRALRGDVYKWNTIIRRVKEKDNWVEIPDLETEETISYMAFLDETLLKELSLEKGSAY